MHKLTGKYKGHDIVVEADGSNELMKYWITAWIDGFTFSRRKAFLDASALSTAIGNEFEKITMLLANNAIIRHTFTDKYGDLQYWRKCTNIDQIEQPGFTPIWPTDKQEKE